MIKFFRRIRQKMLIENKFSKYLLYAIGEILLVVIGILIALSVNNWNNKLQEESKLYDSYKGVSNEISFVKLIIEEQNNRNDSTVVSLQKCLKLLQNKKPDSIYLLEKNLKGLMKLSQLSFDFPITLGFIEKANQEKIKNKNLSTLLHTLKSELSFLSFYQNYAINQYQNLIEPYVVKNLNYAALYNQDVLVNTNQSIDYSVFNTDLELANILNLKLETDLQSSEKLKGIINTIEELNKEIHQELIR